MNWSIGNITWIIIGGTIIGIIARLLLRGRQNIPFWAVIIAGIVGMFVGDWLSSLLGVKETFGFDWIRHGLQLAVGVGAVALISAIFGRAWSGGRDTTAPAAAVGATTAAGAAVVTSAARPVADAAAGPAAAPVAGTAADATAAATSAAPDTTSEAAQGVVPAADTLESAGDAVTDSAQGLVPPPAQ
jgi:uncharacterized membrane protein YeaQ/YmgE (transglycosylase-associated protein family)